eukprot:TRINITY_DN5046_c0_g1_i10.p1 TRINITY_DN5046_c0_g1~~TRINITY_DN5046_c0_g1_i10.p1  ORF type:complete len:137 (+),score=38.72 TRINITY_DN5046_c0_g1_i10:342-752(+)
MENLRILSLGRNLIKKLDNLDSLSHLEELWLSYNWISSLAGIENLKNLKVLYLGNNHINKFRELHRLVELPDLQELVLYGNPIHTESVERNGEINWASSVLAVPTLLSLIHISEPTRLLSISYAVFCLKKKKKKRN